MGLRATSGAARRFGYGALLAALMGSVGTGAIGLALGSASAQSSQQARFDIPAGPLSAALPAFGSQSGLQITYLPSVADGKNSPGVSGTATRGDALSRILQGSGLTWQFTNATTVAISAPAAAPAGGVPTDGSLVLDTISVQGENARGGFEGYVPTRSATAAKTDTPFIESPQTVAVVGRDQMEDQGITTVSESLRYSSGVLTETAGGQSRRFDSFFVRGVGGFGSDAQYASYVDGLRWAFPQRTAIQIDPYLLNRVEVMKGPSSSLYGQGSAGGFVNMVTKTPSLDAKNEVFTTIGSHDRVEAGFDLSGALDKDRTWLYRVVGLGRMADTQVDFQRDERLVIAPSLTWQPTDDTSLTLQAMYHHDPQSPDTAWIDPMGSVLDVPGPGKLPRNYYQGDPNWLEYKRTQASIGYQFDHRFNDTFKFRSSARYGYMESSTRTIENGLWGDHQFTTPSEWWAFVKPEEIGRNWFIAEHEGSSFAIDNNLTAEFDAGPVSHKLLLGIDYLDMTGKQVSNSGNGVNGQGPCITWPRGVTTCGVDFYTGDMGAWFWDAFNPSYGYDYSEMAAFWEANGGYTRDQKLRQTGLYVQDQMEWDKWRLTLNARYDSSYQSSRYYMGSTTRSQAEVSDELFSGRAALAYVFDNGLVPFVGFSTSFDPITLPADLNVDPYLETGNVGYRAFQPQTGSGYEFGLRYQHPDRNLYLSATYFNGRKEKFPIPTGITWGCATLTMTSACWSQDTAARAQGMELEARGEILPGLEFIGSYTWTDAKITRMDPESEMLLESISQMGYLPEGFRPRPVGVPEHMVSLWANYTFPGDALDGLSIGGGVRYVGRMAATFSNVWYDEYSWAMPDSGNPLDSPTFLKRAWVPSRTLFDLSLSYDFGRKFQNLDGMSLNVVATNIFDKKYVAACNGYGTCTYGDGRDIRATLRYRW